MGVVYLVWMQGLILAVAFRVMATLFNHPSKLACTTFLRMWLGCFQLRAPRERALYQCSLQARSCLGAGLG